MKNLVIERNGIFDERVFIETESYQIDIYRKTPMIRITKKGDWRISPRMWRKVTFDYKKGIPKSVPKYIKNFIEGQVTDMRIKKLVNW